MTTIARRIGIGIGGLALAATIGAAAFAAQDQNNSLGHEPLMGQRLGPPPGGPRGPMGRGGMGSLGGLPLGRLDLTEAQRTQVRAMVDAHMAATKPALDRAMAARQALHNAMTANPVDEGAIRSRSAELAAAEADLAVARARLMADITGILTPEQKKELEDVQAQREKRMERMRDRLRERREQRGKQ